MGVCKAAQECAILAAVHQRGDPFLDHLDFSPQDGDGVVFAKVPEAADAIGSRSGMDCGNARLRPKRCSSSIASEPCDLC